jgi:hypothetical protein
MAEVTNDLIFEVLKKVQEDGASTREDARGIREELTAIRGHMLSMQRDIHNIYDRLDEHTRRFERI